MIAPQGRFHMRWLASILVWTLLAAGAPAQTLPYHADPSARSEAPDLSGLPAIRFLTSTGFPPFNYRDIDGNLVGFHIDLARAICAVLTVSCTVQAWPWDQAADALEGNQGDALLAGLAITPKSAARFDFSSVYLMLPGRFVTLAQKAGGFSVDGLKGGSVAVRKGSAHAAFLSDYLPGLKAMPFASEIAALEAVQGGEADAYFGDGLRAAFWLNDNPGCCAFAGKPYFNPRYFGEGMAAAIPKGRGLVREAINFALHRLKTDGKLDELYLRWFPVSFY